MANIVPFDTLAYAKKLEARGVEVKQAEAHAEVLAEVLESSFATRQESNSSIDNLSHEVSILRNDMNTEISQLRSDMNIEISTLRNDMNAEFLKVRNEMSTEFSNVRHEMSTEFSKVHNEMSIMRHEMNAKISDVKTDIIKWVIGLFLAQSALIISMLKFFH